jgi:alpha-galactosidase
LAYYAINQFDRQQRTRDNGDMTTMDFNKSFPTQQIISASALAINLPRSPKLFYRHGWQSWSLAAWADLTPLPSQKPTILHPMQVDPLYAKETCPHSSWVGAVELDDGKVLLLGSLGLDAHVVLEGNRLEGKYESGEGEWFIAHGNEAAVFSSYAIELGKRFGVKIKKPAPRVWCSWYSLYTAIDEKILYKTFDELGNLPFDVLQVDDGWQIKVGDWEANTKFPSGMKAPADKVKSTGRRAGLWLAPLIAVRSSKFFKEHSDWFLRDEHNHFVSAGFNWGEQLFALDTTHPEALDWLAALMKQVRIWGFAYLKLDFLYAGALPGKRYRQMPREAAYRSGLKVMREAMGDDAFLLTCGAPILPSLGLCNAMRVSTDVSSQWESYRDIVLMQNPATPSTKNAIRTTVHRLWLDPLVHLDPDVVYFRSKECMLTSEQKSLLQNLALICNFKATSDLPQWLTSDESEHLRAFLESKPTVKQISRYVFKVDDQTVDFDPAMPLPKKLNGMETITAAIAGWLANRGWVLKLIEVMDKSTLEKIRAAMQD